MNFGFTAGTSVSTPQRTSESATYTFRTLLFPLFIILLLLPAGLLIIKFAENRPWHAVITRPAVKQEETDPLKVPIGQGVSSPAIWRASLAARHPIPPNGASNPV